MASDHWPVKRLPITGLHLDTKNPRLGRSTAAWAPRQIIQHLFDHDKAMDVAQSIATRGYFPNEPLLAIRENGQLVVVEGNRRLAAMKALCNPELLDDHMQRQLERLSRQIEIPNTIVRVPVVVAPSRRATDRFLAGRHIGTPVLAWQAENRASFILEKLAEGYTSSELRDQLGFSPSEVQASRQTRAIAEMARSLDLPDDVMAKLENPRAKVFTTLERVFKSSVGREYLRVVPDVDHGLRIETSIAEFTRGFKRLVLDITRGDASSRTLNTADDIRKYFESWETKDLPAKKRASAVPEDIIRGKSMAPPSRRKLPAPPAKRARQVSKTVLPRDFRVRYGSDRLGEIQHELARLKRDEFPNAGAVLLRVFFELAVVDYLERTGELQKLVAELEQRRGRRLPHAHPPLSDVLPLIEAVADEKLSRAQASKVKRALVHDQAAPFTISDLHAFVHHSDLPSPRDIEQFWNRTEPLFRLILEQDSGEAKA